MNFSRRIGILIASIFFAALLWGYVHLSGNYEIDVDLPLAITAPAGYAVSNDLPQKIHTRISGPGWRLLVFRSGSSSKLKLDLSERDPRTLLTKFYVTRDELISGSSLPSDVKLVKIEPDSLAIQFSREIARKIPIELRTDIQPASGFVVIGEPQITPSSVTIHGSNTIIDSIMAYPTKWLRSRGAHESFTQTIELSDTLADILTSRSVKTVSVRVTIEAVAERTFTDIPVTIEALPSDRELLLDPASLTVVLRGGVDQLAKLKPELLKATITYDAMKFDSISRVAPVIEAPKGIEVLQLVPPEIRFVVRKK
ncbi:MAG TPA: CdaR family protein [Candidatus Kapabacteria bacterium]|nr:CdaR family protein [Candidatus Kapabacteria bacterium]